MAKSALHYRSDDSAGMYRDIAAFVGNRTSRKMANNTYAEPRDQGSRYTVRLHATDVVTFNKEGTITLNSGGYETVTTKERINANTPHSVRVYSRNWDWFVSFRNVYGQRDEVRFRDGMTFRTFGDSTTSVMDSTTSVTGHELTRPEISAEGEAS